MNWVKRTPESLKNFASRNSVRRHHLKHHRVSSSRFANLRQLSCDVLVHVQLLLGRSTLSCVLQHDPSDKSWILGCINIFMTLIKMIVSLIENGVTGKNYGAGFLSYFDSIMKLPSYCTVFIKRLVRSLGSNQAQGEDFLTAPEAIKIYLKLIRRSSSWKRYDTSNIEHLWLYHDIFEDVSYQFLKIWSFVWPFVWFQFDWILVS